MNSVFRLPLDIVSASERAECRVCNIKFTTILVGLQLITLKQQMVIGERSDLLGDRFLALSLPVYQNVST